MEKRSNPKDNASFLSRLFLCWINSFVRLASKRKLTQDDLYELSEDDKAEYILQDFEDVWEEQIDSARRNNTQPRLWKAMARFFPWSDYILILFLRCLETFSKYSQPVLLWFFLKTLEGGITKEKTPYLLGLGAAGIGVMAFVYSFKHHNNLMSKNMGMRLTIACTGLIHKKILKSSRVHLSYDKPGHVFNLVSNDVQRIRDIAHNVQYCLTSLLLSAPVTFGLLCTLIGWQALSGAFVIIICGISQVFMSKGFAHYRLRQAVATDQRLSVVNEIIKGIRTVKMHAWEWSYLDIIRAFRSEELRLARIKTFFLSVTAFFYTTLIIFGIATSVFTLIASGYHLDAVQLFVLLSILQIFGDSAMIQIICTLYTYDNFSSIKRIETFLLNNFEHNAILPDTNSEISSFSFRKQNPQYSLIKNLEEPRPGVVPLWETKDQGSPHLEMTNVYSGWDEDQSTLHNISLQADSSKFVIVTGSVGCGKTTLLMTILHEVPVKSGNISINGKVAYVSQTPWIFTGTLRENILFGKPFDQAKYDNVLDVCDLNLDISKFPKGDLSMIGQRGVMLSGGQRVRVALARAVYSEADIVLLDDPLSAVDAKVGEHILNKCILGELSTKIRILVTHQLQHLHRADHVIVLKHGHIFCQGSYEELSKAEKLESLVGEYKDIKSTNTSIQPSIHSIPRNEMDAERGIDLQEEEEDMESGSVSLKLYWNYFRWGLPTVLVVVLFLFLICAAIYPFISFWWLKVMSTMSREEQSGSYALGVYGGLLAGNLIVPFLQVWLLVLALLKASENMHDKMAISVIKAPLAFFDTNPVGRIINRFSKDMNRLDDSLPMQFVFSAITIVTFVVATLSTTVVNYWYFLLAIPTVAGFLCLCRYYLKPARYLSRLEALRCSPVYDHVSETMEGLEIIHSAYMEDVNMLKLYKLQDSHTRALSMSIAMGRTLGFYVDMLCAIFITLVAVGTILLHLEQATVGLILVICMTIRGNTSYGINMFSDMETYMISVERIMKYTKLPSEPGYNRERQPPQHWPNEGALSVQGLSLRYFQGGARVLEDINFEVKPRERVGIAGRTGAGKTSLVSALFRMPDPEGRAIIDGIDLGDLNIQAARRSMSVISQNPVLFSGSIKHSLDPFGTFPDEQIWAALDVVQMKERVSKLDGLLEYSIGESGSGFSVGETQLLCLARAILQGCKVLILDEATANVDYRTDNVVQQVIRDNFSHCTVLTIAHRLNTIMDYDRVLVLDRGHVVEYDSPGFLANQPDSVFAKLVQSQQGRESP